jgi:hypothetical protein
VVATDVRSALRAHDAINNERQPGHGARGDDEMLDRLYGEALVSDRTTALRQDGELLRRGRLARRRRSATRARDGSRADTR